MIRWIVKGDIEENLLLETVGKVILYGYWSTISDVIVGLDPIIHHKFYGFPPAQV
jgi:hypothetical protein